jgi:hypothetical protein
MAASDVVWVVVVVWMIPNAILFSEKKLLQKENREDFFLEAVSKKIWENVFFECFKNCHSPVNKNFSVLDHFLLSESLLCLQLHILNFICKHISLKMQQIENTWRY